MEKAFGRHHLACDTLTMFQTDARPLPNTQNGQKPPKSTEHQNHKHHQTHFNNLIHISGSVPEPRRPPPPLLTRCMHSACRRSQSPQKPTAEGARAWVQGERRRRRAIADTDMAGFSRVNHKASFVAIRDLH